MKKHKPNGSQEFWETQINILCYGLQVRCWFNGVW